MKRGTAPAHRLTAWWALFVGLVALATGCGSKGAVAVVALIQNPSASVTSSSLARSLNGEFRLHLDLGQLAPSATDVSILTMALVRPTDQASLVLLKLSAAPAPPFHLEPGASVDAVLTIAERDTAPGQLITQPDFDAICAARTVEASGSLADIALGQPIPVSSSPFTVEGCP